MTHGSLFSGIGGFDLAAEWAGWDNIFHCECNPFGQKVLKHHFPKSISYEDITKTDFSIHRGSIDIISGGFPCQPYSNAGKRLGKEDDRHLWPQMLRAIREVQPSWVVGENVRGLTNWNGGMVFDEVQADLEAEGYEVTPFLLPACAVNAPHRRDRIWFVAYSNINGLNKEWRYDKCSKNDGWQSNKEFRTTNSENFNGCDSYANINKQSQISKGIIREGNEQKNNTAKPGGVCKLDKKPNKCERIITKDKDKINNNGALVSQGQDRIQLSENRRMESNCKCIECIRRNELQNDIYGINRMDKEITTDTNSNGQQRSNSEYEINASKGGEYALGNIEQMGEYNAANTSSIGLERECRTFGKLDREIGFSSSSARNMSNRTWQNFPTQSPICGGDDGISKELDNITFSKWRNESIKAYGNAIVPQVAYQIFKAINEYEKI
jgi:DNA (cytosine-5)-methyltransferase 1